MLIERPHYQNLHPGEWPKEGYVSVKFDGMWGTTVIEGDRALVYSRTGKLKATLALASADLDGSIFVGEYMTGTQRARKSQQHGCVMVFDVLVHKGRDVRGCDATDRTSIIGGEYPLIGGRSPLRCVTHYCAGTGPELWQEQVVRGGHEGLVFIGCGAFGEGWARMKASATVDYVCLGYEMGTGRNAGKVTAICGGLYREGRTQHVCTVAGLTDHWRDTLTAHGERYLGRVFTAAGKGVFESGALRHPSFVEWHADKTASMCVAG